MLGNSMMNIMLLVCCVATVCISARNFGTAFWNQWKRENGKSYERVEDFYRRYMWQRTMRHVTEHNAKFKAGNVTFRIQLNKFSDFGVTELSGKFTRAYSFAGTVTQAINESSYVRLPRNVDWRRKNGSCVTSVKDQGGPGSCYAFSAVGAAESQLCRKHGILTDLSIQQILDCDLDNCGGYIDEIFQYFKQQRGIMTEAAYPYTSCLTCMTCLTKDPEKTFIPKINRFLCDSKCKFNHKPTARVQTFRRVPPTEYELKKAVATFGPIAVGIDARHNFPLKSRHNDIYFEPNCSSTDLNHGVLVVGYGTNRKGDYWIVKNSWGEDWGTGGYAKMSRNRDNNCGIATAAMYPILV